jgi:tRNA(His) 5'-end guanylyltransferase
MKEYESAEAGRRLLPLLPVCARIDGNGFSRFTQHLARPFDARLSRLMVDTTRALVEETQALAGYTQSDEISLLWYSADPKTLVFLDRRVQS